MLRFPFSYRVGKKFRPGNGDEKIRCDLARTHGFSRITREFQSPDFMGSLYQQAKLYVIDLSLLSLTIYNV